MQSRRASAGSHSPLRRLLCGVLTDSPRSGIASHATARVASWIAALFLCVPVLILPLFWPGFSSMRQTVSALAAIGAPTRVAMEICACISIVALLTLAMTLKTSATFGRVLLLGCAVSGTCVLLFPLPAPDVDTDVHTLTVTMLAFFLGFWPLASHAKRGGDWAVPLRATVVATTMLIALGVTFWLHWLVSDPATGLFERIFVFSEMAATVLFTHWATRPSVGSARAQAKSSMKPVSAAK